MKCTECLYEDKCELRAIAPVLAGCDGMGKERPPRENEVKCQCCKEWKPKDRCFKREGADIYICFNCF